MGQAKLLLPWRSGTVLDAVLSAWHQSRVGRILVIAGDLAPQYAPVVARYRAELVEVDHPLPEMIDSIRAGLRHAGYEATPPPAAPWLVAPADLPELTSDLIDALLAQFDPRKPTVWIPRSGESTGHPVLLPPEAATATWQLEPHQTLRDVVGRFPIGYLEWPDALPWRDLDTPEEYRDLLGGGC